MAPAALSSDRIGGLIWVVFGAAIVYGSWTMDRLVSLGIPPATAPGVPTGLLGVCIVALGLVLVLRRGPPAVVTYADPGAPAAPDEPADQGFAWRRAALSGALCLAYAGGLLGRGLPYWLLTGVFLFLHLVLLDETEHVPARRSWRRIAAAAVIAPLVTVAVMFVFQNIFLVRLP